MQINIPKTFQYAAHVDAYFDTPAHLAEFKAIVDGALSGLQHSDVLMLIGMEVDELPRLHHSWGRYIRNTFNLWNTIPNVPACGLTKRWCDELDTHVIKDGIDYSVDHPDAVSMMVIECAYHKAIFDRKS